MFRTEGESGRADELLVFSGGPLDFIRVAKKQPDRGGMNKVTTRFGDKQHSAGCKHAVEFTQNFFLLHDMMQQLVAEYHVHRVIGQIEGGGITQSHRNRTAAVFRLIPRAHDFLRVDIHPDD